MADGRPLALHVAQEDRLEHAACEEPGLGLEGEFLDPHEWDRYSVFSGLEFLKFQVIERSPHRRSDTVIFVIHHINKMPPALVVGNPTKSLSN